MLITMKTMDRAGLFGSKDYAEYAIFARYRGAKKKKRGMKTESSKAGPASTRSFFMQTKLRVGGRQKNVLYNTNAKMRQTSKMIQCR